MEKIHHHRSSTEFLIVYGAEFFVTCFLHLTSLVRKTVEMTLADYEFCF